MITTVFLVSQVLHGTILMDRIDHIRIWWFEQKPDKNTFNQSFVVSKEFCPSIYLASTKNYIPSESLSVSLIILTTILLDDLWVLFIQKKIEGGCQNLYPTSQYVVYWFQQNYKPTQIYRFCRSLMEALVVKRRHGIWIQAYYFARIVATQSFS